MKKFYLGALGCLLAMEASAQTFNPVGSMILDEDSYRMGTIGKEFTNSGKGIVYTMEENDNAAEFKLYDEHFNVTQTLNVNINEHYNREVVESREAVVTKHFEKVRLTSSYYNWCEEKFADLISKLEEEVEKDNTLEDLLLDSLNSLFLSTSTVSQFIAEEEGYTVDSVYTVDSINKVCTFFIVSYYKSNNYGKLYPQVEYCLEYEYDDVYAWTFSERYNYYEFAYTGEWVTDVNYYSPEDSPFILRYYDISASVVIGESECGLMFGTQSLFNNDSKLEFFSRVYEEVPEDRLYERDRDGDGETDYRAMYYDNRTKAFEVINEDNEVLATIDCLSNSEYSLPIILKWGDNYYLAIRSSIRGEQISEFDYEYTYSWDIYLIEKATNSIRKVNAAPLMSVMPVLAERNSTVNVTLDVETAKNGGELIITDCNGRTVGRSRVEAGKTSAPVTTDRMGSGVYNIILTEKGQKVENARIIVK